MTSRGSIDRRSFLALGGAGAAGLALAPRPAVARDDQPRRVAKNLIFMVSDGMSFGTLGMADTLIRQKRGRPSNWVRLFGEEGVRRSLIATRSADSLVTDSSAASSAWAIGELINNGRVGMTPDGRFPVPILIQAKQYGKKVGVVTTTRISHATPAGFCCNSPATRGDEGGLAEQMVVRQVDLMLGGGGKFFSAELFHAAKFGGVIARTRGEFLAIDPTKLELPMAGVFNDSHLMFEIDRVNTAGGWDHPPEPSLAEMSSFALRALSRHPQGFAVQIEGGRVDHGGHTNDAAALLYDQVAFDDAIGVAWEFVSGRDDTLLIITADHATANPGLTEYNERSISGFARVHDFKHSYSWIDKQLGPGRTLQASEPAEPGAPPQGGSSGSDIADDRVREVVEAATGIRLESHEIAILQRWRRGETVDPYRTNNASYAPLAAVLANHTSIAFLSPNHTSDPVELTAFGPGSEQLPESMAINDVHEILVRGLELPPAKPA